MDYYKKTQVIARVDRNGKILGEVEKWEAHKKGILHLAFTVTLVYKGQYILQHRKHPAFDGVFDITSSSHQLMKRGKVQDTQEAIYQTLKREWGLKPTDITKPKNIGAVYYKQKDVYSKFIEHEFCEVFTVKVKKLPNPNLTYAYGYSLATEEELKKTRSNLFKSLSPWSQKMIRDGLL